MIIRTPFEEDNEHDSVEIILRSGKVLVITENDITIYKSVYKSEDKIGGTSLLFLNQISM